jgi:hypothetical protein
MKQSFSALLMFLLTLLIFASAGWFGLEVKAGDFSLKTFRIPERIAWKFAPDSLAADDTLAPEPTGPILDTTAQRILYFGDSMIEKNRFRLAEYCNDNGHDYQGVIWYGSTSKEWAGTADLDTLIARHKPTFIFVSLGANEMFVRDLEARESYVDSIIAKIDTIPYVWIGPPNWKPDSGINDILLRHCGERNYYPSLNLTFERASDHVHPNRAASDMWIDSVAAWITRGNASRIIRLDPPVSGNTKGSLNIIHHK